MGQTIIAIYERGVLRPLTPLGMPEQTRLQIQIMGQSSEAVEERQRVHQALLEAGVIQPRSLVESTLPVSEAQLAAAASALAADGPLSEQIIAARDEP